MPYILPLVPGTEEAQVSAEIGQSPYPPFGEHLSLFFLFFPCARKNKKNKRQKLTRRQIRALAYFWTNLCFFSPGMGVGRGDDFLTKSSRGIYREKLQQ
jgi:hypothetical protein